MKYSAGVDVGSTQTKAVIIDEHRQIVARALTDTGANVQQAAQNAFDAACSDGKIDPKDVTFVIGTGYGRFKVTFGDRQVTEISCHGRGAVHMFPNTGTVIDMGGQDSKAIRVKPDGEIVEFCMNDKCAAGTGRFLGAAAMALGMSLSDLGPVSMKSTKPVKISTTCTVFAEAEVLSWLGPFQRDTAAHSLHLNYRFTPEDHLGNRHGRLAQIRNGRWELITDYLQ